MRSVFSAFWRSTLLWTGLLVIGLLLVSAVSGSLVHAFSQAPVWLGMAFVLAAYPGGLAASEPTFEEDAGWMARSMVLLGAGLSASALAFVVTNLVAPAVIDSVPDDPFGATHGMDLGELGAALRSAREAAEAGPPTPAVWHPYNHLAFQYVRRLDGMLLPALFACVGLLAGYWLRAGGLHQRLRTLGSWGLGAFLLVTTYMAGENGYELIVTRAAGPVDFVGDFVLIVPGAVIVALSLSVLADRLGARASP